MLKYSTGLRDKVNGMQGVVKGAIVGITLAFVDGGLGNADTITDSGNGFVDADFGAGDLLFVQGCDTAANDAALTGVAITSVVAGTLTLPTASVNTAETGLAGTVVAVAHGGSVRDVFNFGIMYIYSGAIPADADEAFASSGTLLIRVTSASGAWSAGSYTNGLQFESDASDGELEKLATQTWSGAAVASGTAGYYVLCGNPTDAGAESTTLPRIMGTIGTSGSDLRISSTSIESGKTYSISSYKLTLPAYYGA